MNDYFEHLEHDLRAVVRERRHLRWYSRVRRRQHVAWRWRSGLRPLVALGAAAVAVVVLLGVFGSGGSPTGPSSAAAADLVRLSRVIETQPLTPHRGQYLYIESSSRALAIGGRGGGCRTWAIERRQLWVASDGSGLERDNSGPAHFTSAASRAACGSMAGQSHHGHGYSSETWFGAGCLPVEPTHNWRHLSADPHVLLRQMRRIDGGPHTSAEDFVHVGDFLRDTDAPPRVRAAIYRAASVIPGIQSLGAVHTHDGRRGVGFAYTAQGSTSELIFDPHTGQLLGERSTGDLNYWEDYQPERIVNGLPGNTTAREAASCHTSSKQNHPQPKVSPRQDYPFGIPVLSGEGIGHATFGESPKTVTRQIGQLLHQRPAKPYHPVAACRIDHVIRWAGLDAFFHRGQFVGYAYGAAFQDRPHAAVLATGTGLRVGEPLRDGQRLYGSAFHYSHGRATWSVRTPQGTIKGFDSGPNPHAPLISIEAGDVGCPAMTP